MNCKSALLSAMLIVLMTTLTGCFSSHPKNIEAFLRPHLADVTAEQFILQPPDEIEIHCTNVPEINNQRQRIRPDGKVSFEGIGEVMAAGKTPYQLAEIIKQKALMLYKITGENPIEVRIMAYQSKVYYVLGEVYQPGPKLLTGRDSVLYALSDAKIAPTAWQEKVQVIRPSADKSVKPKIFEVNFDKMIVHGDTSKDVLLQEGDIVFVPPTILAAIAMTIEEFIRPIARAFSGVYVVQSGGDRYVGGQIGR